MIRFAFLEISFVGKIVGVRFASNLDRCRSICDKKAAGVTYSASS